MAKKTLIDTGMVLDENYVTVKFVGATKKNKSIEIILKKALCVSEGELAFSGKEEVVTEISFEGVYSQDYDPLKTTEAPYEIVVDGELLTSSEIILGYGRVYINDEYVGLTRGGAKFSRGAEVREIEHDGARGRVEGMNTIDEVRPTLTVSSLQFTKHLLTMFPGLKEKSSVPGIGG